ncbi:L-2-hydroxyglutarate oxidase LhgO [Comamonas sp. BIGb0124]|uniref:NAD(P)/FAD-dependent oxidoreductase n=1 Tax=Comamonas sp. BIGb0124 TaxID=2485130 RepID=UPI000F462EF4|nr:NAD(P)/FAD-dependent oxidoreductase [Comamonas sp. BIGb0124]ROR25062.1 L-2-hydroxyglutarate oxidase LhgO [Comamonas sp. BIGb0124]
MEKVDAIVIGAGVVGLAVGRELARRGLETVVTEAQGTIGQGMSSRNSEVIHAGLYYAPGSLKARLCVQGKSMLYALCERQGVAHRRCGKLVVATEPAQLAALRTLAGKAEANGVPFDMLDAEQARAMEPELRCVAALSSPTTGIVDSHGFMLALQGDLERAGGSLALSSPVDGVELASAGSNRGHVLRLGDWTVEAGVVVNATGLHAPLLARQFLGLDQGDLPTASFAKGSYYSLAGAAPFGQLIYPAPVDAWLGVHLTLDLGGQARFGPDHEWLDIQSPEQIDYEVDPARSDVFYEAVRRYWPGLADGALQPAYSGVRAKIHRPGEPAPDFRIDGPSRHGVPGLVNLFGVESPGLTSSMAIGAYVADLLALPARSVTEV